MNESINRLVENFRLTIDNIISQNKPTAVGEKGSVEFIANYLKNYGEKLGNCVKEISNIGSEILKTFIEIEEGENKLFKEQIMRDINQINYKFKKKYWT